MAVIELSGTRTLPSHSTHLAKRTLSAGTKGKQAIQSKSPESPCPMHFLDSSDSFFRFVAHLFTTKLPDFLIRPSGGIMLCSISQKGEF